MSPDAVKGTGTHHTVETVERGREESSLFREGDTRQYDLIS